MTAKNSTFAGQLTHFAESVDIVDDARFDNVRDLVYRYVSNQLGGEYFELLRQESGGNGDRQSWLRTFWSSAERQHVWPIHSDDGGYTNPVADAFDNERPMWIVSPEKDTLDQADQQRDLWSGTANLSRYKPSSNQSIRTVVILPLSLQRRYGVYCLESSRYIEITDAAKLELRRLADALAMLYRLWEVNKIQLAGTDHAIGDLRERLQAAKFPRLAKPHFFVAYSHKADETVKHIISDTLKEFAAKLEYTDWTQMDAAGNINTQIATEILESRFGICYLSEPDDDSSAEAHQYRDNPNVVFEAGMLHARTTAAADADGREPAGWIPVREQESPPPPFDFAAERIVQVPRSRTGDLNESRLREMLRKRIEALLRES
jgi:Predicted nucleotide-binding protein containing TIR-like domain